jgi:hypothetical protein
MTQEIINQVTILGDNESLKNIVRKYKVNKGECICNFFPLPNEMTENDEGNFIDKLRLFEKYQVTSRVEWINTYWGSEDFYKISNFRKSDRCIEITFVSQYSDAKIILVNIQKKFPHLKLIGEFQKIDEELFERFETMSKNGEIFYQIENKGFRKYINPIQLRIDELMDQDTNYGCSQAA